MAYSRPSATDTDFAPPGSVYTRPSAGDTDFAFEPVRGPGAVTLGITAAAVGAHGVAGAAAATIDLAAAAAGNYVSPVVDGPAAVTLEILAAATGAHGVAGSAAVTLAIASDAAAGHGVAASADAGITFTAVGTGAHGVSGEAAATLTLSAAAVASHLRYEVRGEVRQGGILVNRRVRAYLRSTGAMVGQGDTVAGKFNVHAGFAAQEHYVVPVDLADAATDYTPPIANRVLSVLASDT